MPGDVRDWDKMLTKMRRGGLEEIVFDIVSMIKAPGTRTEWQNVVNPIIKMFEIFSNS